MKKISIISILCLLPIATFADIVSTEYVDSEKGKLESAIGDKMNATGYTGDRAMTTTASGVPTSTQITGGMITDKTIGTAQLADESVTNAKIATGTIDIKKLNLGTLPTSGKHILTWDNTSQSYKFESIKLAGLQCSAGTYDIGFEQCVNPATVTASNGKYYDLDATSIPSDNPYNFSTPGEWGVTFNGYGTVKGIVSCNSTSGTSREVKPGNTFTQDSEGQYCWCKMTSPSASGWVFSNGPGPYPPEPCDANCAFHCASRVQSYLDFRSAVVSSVGQ